MIDYPANIGTDGFEVADRNNRKQNVDITQPLDYVAENRVDERAENQQSAVPLHKTVIKKLFNID